MQKYVMIRHALQRDPVMSLAKTRFRAAPLATRAEVTRVHCPDYFDRFVEGRMTDKETRVTGFPHSPEGVKRALASTGGTLAATRDLLQNPGMRVAGQLAGGTHHAFYAHGSGFCIFR